MDVQSNFEANVEVLRQQNLDKLRRSIDKAFDNRKTVHLKPVQGGGYDTQESIDESVAYSRELKKIVTGKANEITIESTPGTNEVLTPNSHEYKDLLTLAYRKLGFSEDRIPSMVEKDLKHEFGHHVALLGHKGVEELKYGVEFLYDPKLDVSGIRPFISVSGNLDPLTFKQYYAGPDDPSHTDRIVNKAFNLPIHLRIIQAAKKMFSESQNKANSF